MKEYGKKISRYLMKNKKGRFYCVAGVLYLLAILFVMNDAWLYQTPIVKVTKVVTIVEGKSKKEVADEFRQWLFDCGIEKIIPIAHNLDFDMRFIFRAFPAESKVFSRHGRDSMRLALAVNDIFRRETGEDKFPSVSLRAVKDILNISGESCHHALEDAKDAAHAYRKLTELLTQA